ncbi:ribose-5-phosphate isomerase rki1 [Coniosporium tulheliwenetii]|uniref:Ribose-5-phosphate isomerase rki1 n=1 Tax=Coniosporium tulheliwenetii TaxID=3383036 RepID=A0ACC2ZBP7_9PEZI|nr:ribose-5-phosphate isomerase rki1 [Cladosporium sp. JES 115]
MTDAIESAKRTAAQRAVADHFSPDFRFVGIGSGTTIIYVVEAIKAACASSGSSSSISFVPTGYQSRQVIIKAGLTPVAFDSLPEEVVLDVAFDGADEVDEALNYYRKDQSRLLTKWPSIPIEVCPLAVHTVLHSLRLLGSPTPTDFFIIDAPFPSPLLTSSDISAGKGKGDGSDDTWEVQELARRIKGITGVLEVGLFCGLDGTQAQEIGGGRQGGQRPVAVYFGMEDGNAEEFLEPGDVEAVKAVDKAVEGMEK